MSFLNSVEERHPHRKSPGVYLIHCNANGKDYIGSSATVGHRVSNHLSDLRRGRHPNRHLQRAWTKHGEGLFVFLFIADAEVDVLLEAEDEWIETFGSLDGFNMRPHAHSNRGLCRPQTEEAKRIISEKLKGKPKSAEHRLALSLARRSYSQSRETIEKARASNTGRKRTAEARARMSEGRKAAADDYRLTHHLKGGLPGRASDYKGVYRSRQRWASRLKHQGKFLNLGTFDTQTEAALNFDHHALRLFGEGKTFLNFPTHDHSAFVPKIARPELR